MNIDDITNENVRLCKQSGKPIIDGKCVCSGEAVDKQCGCSHSCHERIDMRKIVPFLIYLASFYRPTPVQLKEDDQSQPN
ncbi:hypothetical protein FJZ53_02690 [Candidatus Woesearchaeota archaeon]|nr:hypothetical protein [Candidatus Woesearchaeota archaeon]